MKLFLVIAVCLIAAKADTVLNKWNEFRITHGKKYKSLQEEKRRLVVFQENLNVIDQHNEKFEKGISTFKMGVTKFADLTADEFKSTQGYVNTRELGIELDTFRPTGVSVDKSIDYVKAGYVTDVKNQEDCGSCWAFSVAGAVEGQVAKEKKILKSLSAQNLLDCAPGNGCRGGHPFLAFHYVESDGILNNEEYPYNKYQHSNCLKRGGWKVTNITGVPATPAAALEALATVGPLSIILDSADLQLYAGGIIDGHGLCKNSLDHAVLIVGAGTEGNTDYFLVKNSYGSAWGPYGGYFKIKRTDNTCGCLSGILYAKLKH